MRLCKTHHRTIFFALASLFVVLTWSTQARANVDLGIGDDETFKRPNAWGMNPKPASPVESILVSDALGPASRPGVSIAWRNAEQVEEVEVRVRNLGDEAGEGRIYVDILDETGKQLLHLEPPEDQKVITLPAIDRGGRDGKVLRMKAHRELNTLIDTYDRMRRRYDVRATVETVGTKDINPFDNSKTKSFNVPFRVRPGLLNTYYYVFKNYADAPVKVRWHFEHTPYPQAWEIKGVPNNAKEFVFKPGEELRGNLTMIAPDKIEEGAFVESRLSLVNTSDGSPFLQHEWFQVYDTEPPLVSNYRMVLTDDHHMLIQMLVADKGAGVLEATGVTTEFSTDDGKTWAVKSHNYKRGNFVRPTLFEADLGPFQTGTKVRIRMTALDTAGNAQSHIPEDGIVMEAPEESTKSLEKPNIFPRSEPSKIFDLDPSKLKTYRVTTAEMPGDKALGLTTIEVTVK